MKYSIAASSLAAASLAAASPQFGGGNRGVPNGDNTNMVGGGNNNWNGAPSCVSSCWQDLRGDSSNFSDFCTGDSLNTLNKCIADSSCDQSDKDATYQAIAQGCANAGQTVTASPQATFSATSGKNLPTSDSAVGPHGGPGNAWQGKGGDWTTNSDWQSWTSAHPTPSVTDAAAWSSWASSASWPTASSDWSSWASAKGLPSAAISGGGFPFAFGGPGPFSSVVSLLFKLCPRPAASTSCPLSAPDALHLLIALSLTFSRRLCLAFCLDFQLRIRLRPIQLANSDNRRTRSLRRLGSWWQQLRPRRSRRPRRLERRQRRRSLRRRWLWKRLGSLVFQDIR